VASVAGPLSAAQSKSQQADTAFETIRAQLTGAVQRIAMIRIRYGNTSAEDEVLRRLLPADYARTPKAESQPPSQEAKAAPPPDPSPSTPVDARKP
jgi:hypothetical protein